MPQNRFFLDTPFSLNQQATLDSVDEIHHFKVMRIREQETIELVNGRNQLAIGNVLSIHKNAIQLVIQSVTEVPPPAFSLILCQALCRPNRLDTIIEKTTELGATELWLFPGELSEKKELSPKQLTRLVHLTISAMKQSGRISLPKIILKPGLSHWKKSDLPFPAYFGDVDPKSPPLSIDRKETTGALFFVGPEAGFTPKEEKTLTLMGVLGVKLNENILRTDTAAIAALSIMMHR